MIKRVLKRDSGGVSDASRCLREAAGEETRAGAEVWPALASARSLRALARGSVERRSSPLSARRRMDAGAISEEARGVCRRGLSVCHPGLAFAGSAEDVKIEATTLSVTELGCQGHDGGVSAVRCRPGRRTDRATVSASPACRTLPPRSSRPRRSSRTSGTKVAVFGRGIGRPSIGERVGGTSKRT